MRPDSDRLATGVALMQRTAWDMAMRHIRLCQRAPGDSQLRQEMRATIEGLLMGLYFLDATPNDEQLDVWGLLGACAWSSGEADVRIVRRGQAGGRSVHAGACL